MTTRKLYRYSSYHGRMGDLEGLLIATEAQIEKAIGHTVYWGEVLGKHSDISVTLESHHFVPIPKARRSTIRELIELFGYTISGYNPLAMIQCWQCYSATIYGEPHDDDCEVGEEEDDNNTN